MAEIFSLIIGYLLGSVSPSYIISKKKNIDLRKSGTKNLGASNTFMSVGKKWGMFVMFFDIFKAFLAVRLSRFLFPQSVLAGVISGSAAVMGHNHPFYLKFKGGKGIAAFGGFILGFSPMMFLIMLAVCLVIAIIANYSCMLSFSAAIIFPFLATYKLWADGASIGMLVAGFLVIMVPMISVIVKHRENLRRIKSGEEHKFSAFLSKFVLSSKGKKG